MNKLKLLFAAFAAMVSMGTSAQLTDGTVYWLQDASTGQFLSQGGNWGTQATLQDVGGVGFEAKYVSDGVFKLKNIMWNKVNNADLGLNIVEHDGYCDQNASDITLTASGDGYKLSAIKDSNPRYIVNNQSNNSYGVKGIGFTNDASEATIWKFLSKSEYDAAIQAYKDAKASSYATELGYTAANVSALETLINDENKFVRTVYTSSIANAALNAGNTDGWTSIQPNQRDKAFGSEKNTMAEAWNGCVVASQSVTGLPNGLYKVTFVGTFRPKGSTESEKLTSEQTSSPAYVFANDAKEEFIHWIDVSAKANNRTNVKNNATSYTSSFYTYVTDGTINLGVKQDTWYAGNMWCPFGYFTLTYYSDQVSDEAATAILSDVTTLEGKKMNVDVLSALSSAKTTFDGNRTIANYNALNTAMTNANACVTAYAGAKAFFDEVDEVLANTNVYTAAAYATYYTEPKAKYEDNTLTTEEANALVKSSGGWHSENTIDDILLSSWTIGGSQCKDYDTGLYINTWSTEGNNDGSEFYTPFFEYWTGDDNSLGANTLTSTITGLTANATYSFTIRARARNTNNQTIVPKKIMMKVGEGTAVDISAGTHFGSTQFYIGNFSAVGQADAEGKLVTTITVSEGSNVSWLSFYNCKYTEGEDLSAYIADYEFALNTAQANNTNTAYAAITGKEKADLVTAISTYGTVDNTDKAALIAAKNELETASNAFVNAAYDYTTLADLNENVATKLGVTWPTVNNTTTAADINAKAIVVAEVTAAKAYATDVTDKLGAWSATPKADQKGESWDGTTTDTYYDSYNGEVTMTQNVTLAEGDYALIFKCRASAAANVNVTDGTNTVRFAHKGNTGYGIATDGTATFDDGATYARSGAGQGWEYRVLTFTSDGTTPTTLTFNWNTKTNQWAGLDDIELRANLVVQDYSALEAAYNAVASNVFGFEKDEYAPYTNLGNMAIVKAAKDMLQNEDAVNQAAINSLKDEIEGLTWTVNAEELNAIYDGTFAAAENNGAPVGWTMSNNTLGGATHSRAFVGDSRLSEFNETNSAFFLRFDGTYSSRGSMYYYGNTENYVMPLKEGKKYRLTVDFAGWGSTGKPLRLNITGPTGFSAVSQEYNTNVNADTENKTPQQFNIVFTASVAGNYVISFQTPGADTNTHMVVVSNLVLKTDKETVTITDAGYATYVSDNDLDYSSVSGLTAYKATVSGSTINFEKVTTVPAGEGVLLKGEAKDYAVPVTAGVATWADADNAFIRGTGAAVETGSNPFNYILNNVGGVVGFYKANGQIVATNRAYIQAPVSASRLSFVFDDEEEVTGIKTINAVKNGEAIYNLNGQRVNKAKNGLYILNGRKVMFK